MIKDESLLFSKEERRFQERGSRTIGEMRLRACGV